jgi:hypothetical protein
MMQIYMGKMLLLGITKGNVDKIKEGQPIFLKVQGKEPVQAVVIVYGEDKPAILELLKKEFNFQIHHWMQEEAEKEPS